jgi:hypothetical protein
VRLIQRGECFRVELAMSVNIPNHYYTEYSRNLDLLLQQKDSRLSAFVMQGSHTGEKASPVDQFGAVEMEDVVSRFEPATRQDAPAERRWVFPVSSELRQSIDHFDKLKILTDPQGIYVQNGVAAANRRRDRHIISAFFANSAVGVNAGSTESFGTGLTTAGGYNVGVNVGGATSSLNVAKLKEVARRMMELNVDVEAEGGIHCAITAKEHDSLLNELQVINADYGTTVFGQRKLLTSWWIFDFHHTELVQTGTDDQTGTSRAVPCWVKSGMHLGMWETQTSDIVRRDDLKGRPWEAVVNLTAGATRTELGKVIRVWCR